MTENQSNSQPANYLAAGINQAVPPRTGNPPPPPVVKRARERDVEDNPRQNPENANLPISKGEETQNGTQINASPAQGSDAPSISAFSDEQVRLLAQMINSANATTQQSDKAKRQKIDLADLLIQTIANSEGSEDVKKQLSKLANSQKTKINQGVFAPEALFNIYRNSSVQLGTKGKKIGMGDLMAKALIAYVPEIIRQLEEE